MAPDHISSVMMWSDESIHSTLGARNLSNGGAMLDHTYYVNVGSV